MTTVLGPDNASRIMTDSGHRTTMLFGSLNLTAFSSKCRGRCGHPILVLKVIRRFFDPLTLMTIYFYKTLRALRPGTCCQCPVSSHLHSLKAQRLAPPYIFNKSSLKSRRVKATIPTFTQSVHRLFQSYQLRFPLKLPQTFDGLTGRLVF